ncbi:MAG: hypothetical protein MUE41_04325, partial [Gemmatimonadaceae bacterium]|nr:hypothetical protein [Gemmatimonadaceae bacterium]
MSRRVTACALAGALVAGTTALTACQRDAVAEVPPAALVTQRVRGTISGPPDAPRWTPCADDTSGARAVDRSAALDSAR